MFYDIPFFLPDRPDVKVRLVDGKYVVEKPNDVTIQALRQRPPEDQTAEVAALTAEVARLNAIINPPPPPPPPPPDPPPTGTPPYATSATLESVDEYGIARGTIHPPGAQLRMIINQNDQVNMPIATSDAAGNFVVRLPVLGGNHKVLGLLQPYRSGAGNRTEELPVNRSNTQQPMPAKPKAAPGLAAKYTKDRGLETDPDVLFYVDFADPNWPTRYFNYGNVAELSERPVDIEPLSGLPRVNMQYTPDGRFSPCGAGHDFKKAGKPEPDELFYRYYFQPKPGYQCSLQPKKLPGLAGRYGPAGNGGNRTTGKMETDGLYGWSARNLALEAPGSDWLIPIGTYTYQADMAADFGDTNMWDCQWMEANKGYCLEQQVTMNTIDMSAPDALGNGVGRYDGILRCWMNDELVFENTKLRFRHHPAIHINEVWMNHFHGGTTPPEDFHPFAHWGMVVARKRIGEINLGTVAPPPPPPGPLVATAISHNTMRSANPCAAELTGGSCNWSGIGGMRVILDFTGGIWNPDAKTFLCVGGGEHFSGPAMGFHKPTGLWSVASAITTAETRVLGYANDPTFDTKWCAFSDGVMAIGHTYDTVEYVPSAWGITGDKGGFILPVRDVVYGVGSCYRPVICDSATLQWRKAASEGLEGVAQTSQLNTGGGNSCVLDAANRRYLMISGATSRMPNDRIATLTFADTSGIGVQSRGPLFAPVLVPRSPVQIMVPEQRKVIIAGNGGGAVRLVIQMYDADALDGIRDVAWQGDDIYHHGGLGLAWCPWAGCFMAMPVASTTYDEVHSEATKPVTDLFRITPDWSGKPWTVTRVPITGAVGYTPEGIKKRFFADASDQTVNWVMAYDGAFYSVKVV